MDNRFNSTASFVSEPEAFETLYKFSFSDSLCDEDMSAPAIMDLNYPLTLFISFNLVTPLCDEACAEKKIKFDKTNEEKKVISIPRVTFLFLPIKKKFE